MRTLHPAVCYAVCQTFISSLIVSVWVSALERTDLHFVDAGVKIVSTTLCKNFCPISKELSGYFILQRDSPPACAYRAQETVDLLERLTPDFIPSSPWPPSKWSTPQPVRLPDMERSSVAGLQPKNAKYGRVVTMYHRGMGRLDQRLIDKPIIQWRRWYLCSCVPANLRTVDISSIPYVPIWRYLFFSCVATVKVSFLCQLIEMMRC